MHRLKISKLKSIAFKSGWLVFFIAICGNANARVDKEQQQNALCYVKVNAPELVFGKLPFSCNKQPEKFVEHVKYQIKI